MQDLLKDIVAHTNKLGFLNIVKITGTTDKTLIESMSDDRSVIMFGETLKPQAGLEGIFGMPQLDKLRFLVECQEYQDGANISIVKADRNGEMIPVGLDFANKSGDFKNTYRFMNTEIINEKLKTVKFRGVKWNVEIEPSLVSIQRLKFQSQANSEQPTFVAKTENKNLVFYFGDPASHTGNFIFASDVTGNLTKAWNWPVSVVNSILALPGDKTLKFSDEGAAQITVNSGLAIWNYILPAQTK